jgi:hypothetical protein
MLVENSAFKRAKMLEEEMRKNSLVHMAISTAKTILYYTPIIFVTRFELLLPGNTKGGSITVLLTSCLTGLESAV